MAFRSVFEGYGTWTLYTLTARRRKCTVNTMNMCGEHLRCRERVDMANAKDVVVTGVSTGIGLGTTKVLIANGYRVFGSVRKQADADRLQKEFGDRYAALLMDITDTDAIRHASEKVGAMIGSKRLAGLVNNAAIVV